MTRLFRRLIKVNSHLNLPVASAVTGMNFEINNHTVIHTVWSIHICFVLPFQKFFISSKTYEPFMYLAVPVPNPALVSYQVGFISQVSTQGAQCILYVSVQIEPDSKITTLIKSVLEKLKNDDNVKPNAVKLYEVKKAR